MVCWWLQWRASDNTWHLGGIRNVERCHWLKSSTSWGGDFPLSGVGLWATTATSVSVGWLVGLWAFTAPGLSTENCRCDTINQSSPPVYNYLVRWVTGLPLKSPPPSGPLCHCEQKGVAERKPLQTNVLSKRMVERNEGWVVGLLLHTSSAINYRFGQQTGGRQSGRFP